ncbi:MAG: hypothetical protein N2484_17090 [Clostridia bacterium]|nr:hypothetical protein [Clostridia bacterium]
MLQMILNLTMFFISGFIIYLTCCMSAALASNGAVSFGALNWLLEATPALFAFLSVLAQLVSVAFILVSGFMGVSNHRIISLDILYFITLLLIVRTHRIKEPGIPLVTVG